AALLPSCFGVQVGRTAGPVALAYNFAAKTADPVVTPEDLPHHKLVIGQVAVSSGAVVVRGFHEPGDFAHRNYCGAGATQVLLSGWMRSVPDIEAVAARSHLNPSRGEYGADALSAINGFLGPVVDPAIGHPWYRAEHVTALDGVMSRIRSDIDDPTAVQTFGHGVPVIVQTMTRTMPGWNHWNATHMITIFAFDFRHNDPS